MSTTHKIHGEHMSEEEKHTFISYAKELQDQAIEMWDNAQDKFEKELFISIYKLALSAEKHIKANKIEKAWRDVGQIINKGLFSNVDEQCLLD